MVVARVGLFCLLATKHPFAGNPSTDPSPSRLKKGSTITAIKRRTTKASKISGCSMYVSPLKMNGLIHEGQDSLTLRIITVWEDLWKRKVKLQCKDSIGLPWLALAFCMGGAAHAAREGNVKANSSFGE